MVSELGLRLGVGWGAVLNGVGLGIQRGSSQACGEVAIMFQSDSTLVRNALSSPQVRKQ